MSQIKIDSANVSGFRTMADGGYRLSLDIPETDTVTAAKLLAFLKHNVAVEIKSNDGTGI